ncbi:hypothetical protein SAMN05660662_3567 [Blastococcus aurantiacus]|uniref:Uncharacterized protein n=1 Tax=Blastococcus aurantiacus TaxID=1550231 RepID=A0A1G7PB84_9ACTN|nr:hypothetical protein [Blastococcus aurantiacus]SDF83562.1 hypothetical protein SAMN05660662_3567 [Blastococcus aurantiacus]
MRVRRPSTTVPRTSADDDQARAALGARWREMPVHQQLWSVQVLLGMGLLIESSVVEIAVPVGRALAGKRGVQTGPALGSLLTFLAFQAYTTAIGHEAMSQDGPADEEAVESRLQRWLDRTILSGAEYLPAFGAVLPATVVLRKRSPLWGLALWPLVRLIAVTVLAAEASRLKKLHGPDASKPEGGAA